MSTRRAAYLGLLVCLVTTTALGMQPQLLGSALVEPESGDSPSEEPAEKEVKSDSGILVRRRGTLLVPTIDVPPAPLWDFAPPVMAPLRASACNTPCGNRNGYGGPLRL